MKVKNMKDSNMKKLTFKHMAELELEGHLPLVVQRNWFEEPSCYLHMLFYLISMAGWLVRRKEVILTIHPASWMKK